MDDSDGTFPILEEQQGQPDGVLDRIDRALVNALRALWRCIVDGFAAYGAAECGLALDPAFEQKSREAHIPAVELYPYNYGAVWEGDLRSDYADIDALIRALKSVGK